MRKAAQHPSSASPILLTISFLSTLLAPPARAAHIWGEEAWQLDSSAWPSTLRSANATGQVSIPARNLSLPYPGTSGPSEAEAAANSQSDSHSLEDWSLVIRVAAAVPVAETDSNDDDAADVDDIPDDEAFFTATEISYRPPSDLNDRLGPNGTHPSWNLCQHFFRSAKLTSEDEAEVSPDCEGVLSHACRTDLLLQLRGSYGSSGSGSGDGDRDSAENGKGRDSSICSAGAGGLPASCLDEMRGENSDPGETQEEEERFDFMSGSAGYSLNPGNPRYGVRFGHGNHSADDHDDYDAAIRQIWVAAFIWGPRNASAVASSSTDGDEDGDEAEASLPPGTLSCIRASDVEEGSRLLEDGAVTAHSPGAKAWAALAVAAGVVALMV